MMHLLTRKHVQAPFITWI